MPHRHSSSSRAGLAASSRKARRDEYLSHAEQVRLAQRAVRGDGEAWGRLYGAFHKALLGHIAVRIGSLEDARDLCQETFIRAEKNLKDGKYDPRYSFYVFLCNIAFFLIRKHWARALEEEAEGAKPGPDPGREDPVLRIADPRVSQELVVMRLEMLQLLSYCCAKPHQILAVELVKLLEWKPQEVVAELSHEALGTLSRMFFRDYLVLLGGLVAKRTLYRYASPQFRKIRRPVAEVYVEPVYEEKLSGYRERRVRELVLRLFYSSGDEASLHDWCNKVKTRMRIVLETGIICEEAV